MRYVFTKDVKKLLLRQARTIYWKKWAANHEYEKVKDGICLEPTLALLDCSILDGRTKATAKDTVKKSEMRDTGFSVSKLERSQTSDP